MKFILTDYKGKLTDMDILEDIKRVSKEQNIDYISIATYKKFGKFSQCAIQGHFGTWKNALLKCGLRTEKTKEELKQIKNEDYYIDLKRIAEYLGQNTVSYKEYEQYGKYSAPNVFRRFKTWDDLLISAELQPTGLARHKIDDKVLLDEIERIWTALGRQPTSTDIIKGNISTYSIDTFKRRFGGWRGTLEAFIEYINDDTDNNVPEYEEIVTDSIKDNIQSAENIEIKKTQKHKTPRTINARLRFKILKRDNFKCCACGSSPAIEHGVQLHIDHILPWSVGGETIEENLQTLCSKCNLGKSNSL